MGNNIMKIYHYSHEIINYYTYCTTNNTNCLLYIYILRFFLKIDHFIVIYFMVKTMDLN